jgi:hypothetical protein
LDEWDIKYILNLGESVFICGGINVTVTLNWRIDWHEGERGDLGVTPVTVTKEG